MKGRRPRFRAAVVAAAAMLPGCGDDHHRRSPLAIPDYRLGAIERRIDRLAPDGIDKEMLAVDADAYDRPEGASFREAVGKFYTASHPLCVDWAGEPTEARRNFVHDARFMLDDFAGLVGRTELTPLRRDLELAWRRAALGRKKDQARRDCVASGETQREVMRNAKGQMRDALDRMEAAINAAAG